MTIHIYTTDQVMFIYSTLYNTDSQLHSTKEENNRINDADFFKYETNSNSSVKQL